jgi:hypothetical protein
MWVGEKTPPDRYTYSMPCSMCAPQPHGTADSTALIVAYDCISVSLFQGTHRRWGLEAGRTYESVVNLALTTLMSHGGGKVFLRVDTKTAGSKLHRAPRQEQVNHGISREKKTTCLFDKLAHRFGGKIEAGYHIHLKDQSSLISNTNACLDSL